MFTYSDVEASYAPYVKPLEVRSTKVFTKEQIGVIASISSGRYGVDYEQLMNTIECESTFKNVQSNIYLNGVRENSWGIAQINLDWNPEVTKEQALDPYFAVDFMAKKFDKGLGKRWTCYRKIYSV